MKAEQRHKIIKYAQDSRKLNRVGKLKIEIMFEKNEMSELLRFRPNPIFDPVPWILIEQLEREQIMQIGRIQLEFQTVVNEAYGKAIQQVSELVGNIK